jgi:hypothetical protein
MSKTPIELWHQAWPEVPWLSATPEDVRLYMDHASSVAMFNDWMGYE